MFKQFLQTIQAVPAGLDDIFTHVKVLVSTPMHRFTRIKDAGIAIAIREEGYFSILQGPEMSLGVVDAHLKQAKLSSRDQVGC